MAKCAKGKGRLIKFRQGALAAGTPLLISPEKVIPGFIWIFKVYLIKEIRGRKVLGVLIATYRINSDVKQYFEPMDDIEGKFWPIYEVGQKVKLAVNHETLPLGEEEEEMIT